MPRLRSRLRRSCDLLIRRTCLVHQRVVMVGQSLVRNGWFAADADGAGRQNQRQEAGQSMHGKWTHKTMTEKANEVRKAILIDAYAGTKNPARKAAGSSPWHS